MPGPVYQRPDGVLFREVEDAGIIVDLERERYFGLDGIAADMYGLLLTRDPEEALSVLTGRYDVSDGRLRTDLRAFAARLVEAGLLQVVGGQR